MVTQHLIPLFQVALDQLKTEINAYQQDSNIWAVPNGVTNSAGNLCLHLVGNLQHFIGATLGDTGYVRNREAEFKVKNVPRAKLLEEIDETRNVVTNTLEECSRFVLQKDYPILSLGYPVSTEYFLLHLLGHLHYHIGQINYHRRIVEA